MSFYFYFFFCLLAYRTHQAVQPLGSTSLCDAGKAVSKLKFDTEIPL